MFFVTDKEVLKMTFKVLCILTALLFSWFCLSQESIKYQFYQAAKSGNFELVKEMARVYDINDTKGSGLEGPALNIAVHRGDIGAVNILLDAGADISIEGWSDGFPLHIAAKSGNVEMIRFLHSKGANINAVNNIGLFPIHSTAWFGHIEAFKVLNELGAGIHERAKRNGESILHRVARGNHPQFIEVLVLQFRLAVDVRSHLGGYTPLHEAVRTWSFESVKKLVELGADIYAHSGRVNRWVTPLDLARQSGNTDIKEFLMQEHQRHKQEKYSKALRYEVFMTTSDSVKKSFNRGSGFINSCRNLFRRFALSK